MDRAYRFSLSAVPHLGIIYASLRHQGIKKEPPTGEIPVGASIIFSSYKSRVSDRTRRR